MSEQDSSKIAFNQLGLSAPVLAALDEVGYETPSPIQAETIPVLLAGRDLVGQAQTGTGKTAAFALPLLSRIDLSLQQPQLLVLAPTRELALQVAEAFQRYASKLKGFHVLPIYGGQDFKPQLQRLRRGAHVIVGTPGRVMDHMRRGTLVLDNLKGLVLDEADEMLRMGFIDDVEWILEQTPSGRQVALFSATMPKEIRRIASAYLKDPQEVRIKVKTTTADTINQRFWTVSGFHKLDALTRILEAETFDAVIVFVRTRLATVELAEKLAARGYNTAALNGDIVQKQREKTVSDLKAGNLDIIVATDVAARGLDVQRISHVINYDIPYDTEAYVHRIGRTGRAGRKGEAILFVAPREQRMLAAIERATRQKITRMELPSTEELNDRRVAAFKQRITDTLAGEGLDFYQQLIESYRLEHNTPAIEIAAALAKLAQGDRPLLLKHVPKQKPDRKEADRGGRKQKERTREEGRRPPRRREQEADMPAMVPYRIEVGERDGVKPGNIVGAIANEAGLDGQYIRRIEIHEDHTLLELPDGMPRDIQRALKKAWVCGKQLRIRALEPKPKGGKKRVFKAPADGKKPGKKPRKKKS